MSDGLKAPSEKSDLAASTPMSRSLAGLLTPRGFVFVLAILVLASYWELLLTAKSLFQRDFLLFGYPVAHYHKTSLLGGELPLWNPLSHCGLPYLGQWNTMVLYPGSLIYLAFPLPWSLNVFVVFHTYAAGLGMYFLARYLTRSDLAASVAAVGYAFSGLLQDSLLWPNNIAAFGLLPWVLLVVDRACREGGQWLVIAALTGGVQMLSGAPEVILFTWATAGLLTLFVNGEGSWNVSRERTLRMAMIVVWVAALAAVQLLPFLELLAHSARVAADGTVHWGASIQVCVNLFVPVFETVKDGYGDYYQTSQSWTRSVYPGLAVLFFVAGAIHRNADRRVWLLSVAALFVLALAPGQEGAIYSALDPILPLGLMRFPVKFLILLTPVLPLLAAFGVREIGWRSRHENLIAMVAVAVVAVTAFAIAVRSPTLPEIGAVSLVRQVIFLALFGGIVGVVLVRRQLSPIFCVGLLLVQWVDLRWHLPGMVQVTEREALELEIPADHRVPVPESGGFHRVGLSHLARNGLMFRHWPDPAEDVVMRRLHLAENLNLPAGNAKVGGFFSMWFHEQEEVVARLYTDEDEINTAIGDFLGIRHVKTFRRGLQWRTRTNAMPLVTAGQQPIFRDGLELLDGMTAEAFDPRRTVFLPSVLKNEINLSAQPDAVVTGLSVLPHEISCEVASPGATMVVIAQNYYPNWTCRVNGRVASVYRSNNAFQSVVVPAGTNSVRLSYEDRAFRFGAIISAIALLAALVIWRRMKSVRAASTGAAA
jgi:hypothetical protein